MSFYNNGYGAPVPDVLTAPVAYHTIVLRRSFRGPRGVISGTNSGDLAEKVTSDTNLGDLVEELISGTNPEDFTEELISGTNPRDLAEKVTSCTNLGDLAEEPISGTNPGDFVERLISGTNPGDLVEKVTSGTNLEDLFEEPISSTNLGDFTEGLISGTNPRFLAKEPISDTNLGDLAEKVISGTNPRDLTEGLFASCHWRLLSYRPSQFPGQRGVFQQQRLEIPLPFHKWSGLGGLGLTGQHTRLAMPLPPYLFEEEFVLVDRLKGILSSSRMIKEMIELWLVNAYRMDLDELRGMPKVSGGKAPSTRTATPAREVITSLVRETPKASSKRPIDASTEQVDDAARRLKKVKVPQQGNEGQVKGLKNSMKIWNDSSAAEEFERGLLHPQLARELYTLPSEILLAQELSLSSKKELTEVRSNLAEIQRLLKEVRVRARKMDDELLQSVKALESTRAELPKQAVDRYKESTDFKEGLKQMGRVTYEYGYRVALARFRALHPDSEVEKDPFTIHPEVDLVQMKRQQAFDDSDPPES
ncbi:hypothetical protein B296_00009486 [Ensete ventricosum]|uniref:Uncharacterized protein n=1 Tax=Ensete ventricosum TaxID=4639 RepID=A0A427AGX1_ENSVE|nr:hypothetical protein B296_00009486 [Ensete ventricosum]